MRLSALYLYPVKSCAGIALQESVITALGLEHDRRWMIVDPGGNFQSQRGLPVLALVQPSIQGLSLYLNAPSMPELCLPLRLASGTTMNVLIWDCRVPALVHEEGSRWISEFTGRDLRMVCFDESAKRAVPQPPEPLAPLAYQANTLFSDGYPFLLIGQTSLDELNAHLQERHQLPIDMRRFRPNLVVEGALAFEEDLCTRLSIGELDLNIVKPCSRCIIPNVDPDSGETGAEPGETLERTRRGGSGEVFFGQNLILSATSLARCSAERLTIRVGDSVGLS